MLGRIWGVGGSSKFHGIVQYLQQDLELEGGVKGFGTGLQFLSIHLLKHGGPKSSASEVSMVFRQPSVGHPTLAATFEGGGFKLPQSADVSSDLWVASPLDIERSRLEAW